jgi:DNA recombination protein RmuC
MLVTLIALQALALIALLMLLLRRATPAQPPADPRLAQLLAADLPTQITRLDARFDSLDTHLRAQLAEQRAESASRSAALRSELITNLTTLSSTLTTSLDKARQENESAAERLRSRVQEGLQQLNTTNAAKLEEMRVTVDEKLHATLQTRLTESFGQVTDQLTKVHAGLGEMTKLSAGVDDLSRIFTNVKSRGGIGELALELLLKDRLAPSQYIRNAKVKPNSQEMVEFAVRFPTPNGEMLLPIDSKFPREVFERLENAYESGTDVVSAGKAFEAAIRFEGKKICDKYIAPPTTTSFAIMFLPTEGLYAEVIRRDGLMADIQQNCRVTIAGPSTLSAILTSFQMGFHMLQMQEKGDEVWKVLANARTQFGKFEDLMGKMSKDVERVQNTIGDVATRTRAINRTLRDVSVDDTPALAPGKQGAFDGLLPMLAASDDE